MSKRNPRVQVQLYCGHFGYWNRDAAVNDARTCTQCREVTTVRQYWEKVWHARCVGGCDWGRFAGQDKHAAGRLAGAHKHLTAVVYDFVEETLREPLLRMAGDDMLPLFTEKPAESAIPPF